MNNSEKKVLEVGIEFIETNRNNGWFSYSTKRRERFDARDIGTTLFNQACVRLVRCGMLEDKVESQTYPDMHLARLSTVGLARVLLNDPDLLPDGDKVRVKSNGKYGVVLSYEATKDGDRYFVVILDGERDKKYYRFGEIEYVPDS